jgi:hypothetical protein
MQRPTTWHPQRELYQYLERRTAGKTGHADNINRCLSNRCVDPDVSAAVTRVEEALRGAARMQGEIVAFLRVRMGGKPEDDLAYTLISSKAYKHVRSMFADEKLGDRRDYENDTQTVVRRLEGS